MGGLLAILLWIGVGGLLGCDAAVQKPSFTQVTTKQGLRGQREVRLEQHRLDLNKYWGCTIADLDGDEVYDMVLGNHGNSGELYWGGRKSNNFKFNFVNLKNRAKDTHGTAAADLDNDGRMEFVFSRGGSGGKRQALPLVYSPEANRRLEVSEGEKFGLDDVKIRGRSVAFLDIDLDGDLDLLYVNKKFEFVGQVHVVYENLGNGKFRHREDTGLERSEAFWFELIDANGDGILDVLLNNFDRIALWVGTGGFKFREKTWDIFPRFLQGSRNPAIGWRDVRCGVEIDIDNDGEMELYLARGQRLGIELEDILLKRVRGKYVDISKKAGIQLGGNHYHVTAGDFNLDGFQDLYISRMGWFEARRPNDIMLLNQGDGTFKKTSGIGTSSRFPYEDGDSSCLFDYNKDGRLDLLVGSRRSAWRLYENRTAAQGKRYVTVLVGKPRPAAFGIYSNWSRTELGAIVKVKCGRKIFTQRVGGMGSSHSQSPMTMLHFGVGTCTRVNQVAIDYLGGVKLTRFNVKSNKEVRVGLFGHCRSGFTGKNCNSRIERCKANCPRNRYCEVYTKGRKTVYCPFQAR